MLCHEASLSAVEQIQSLGFTTNEANNIDIAKAIVRWTSGLSADVSKRCASTVLAHAMVSPMEEEGKK
jgi:hypothetical protein